MICLVAWLFYNILSLLLAMHTLNLIFPLKSLLNFLTAFLLQALLYLMPYPSPNGLIFFLASLSKKFILELTLPWNVIFKLLILVKSNRNASLISDLRSFSFYRPNILLSRLDQEPFFSKSSIDTFASLPPAKSSIPKTFVPAFLALLYSALALFPLSLRPLLDLTTTSLSGLPHLDPYYFRFVTRS